MKEDKTKEQEAQDKLSRGLLQGLIRVSALERVLLQKNLFTEGELAEALAKVVSDVTQTAKEELGVDLEQDSD